MASADFCLCIPHRYRCDTRYAGQRQTSPGNPLLSSSQRRRIYLRSFRTGFGLHCLRPDQPGTAASYPVRVPRFGTSSTPSFPPRLATTQLASSYASPCGARGGLAPPHNTACRAHLITSILHFSPRRNPPQSIAAVVHCPCHTIKQKANILGHLWDNQIDL